MGRGGKCCHSTAALLSTLRRRHVERGGSWVSSSEHTYMYLSYVNLSAAYQ